MTTNLALMNCQLGSARISCCGHWRELEWAVNWTTHLGQWSGILGSATTTSTTTSVHRVRQDVEPRQCARSRETPREAREVKERSFVSELRTWSKGSIAEHPDMSPDDRQRTRHNGKITFPRRAEIQTEGRVDRTQTCYSQRVRETLENSRSLQNMETHTGQTKASEQEQTNNLRQLGNKERDLSNKNTSAFHSSTSSNCEVHPHVHPLAS
jgi:protein-arginine kinase activator protein McsA